MSTLDSDREYDFRASGKCDTCIGNTGWVWSRRAGYIPCATCNDLLKKRLTLVAKLKIRWRRKKDG